MPPVSRPARSRPANRRLRILSGSALDGRRSAGDVGRRLVLALCLAGSACTGGETDGRALARQVPSTTSVAPPRPTTTSTAPASTTTSGATEEPSADDVVLRPDGLGVVAFGDDAEVVLAELTARLGPPTDDGALPSCPSGEIDRLVSFAGLSVLFAATGGVERLVAWDLEPASQALPRPATAEGISVGSSLDELRSAYGALLELSSADPFGPGFEIDVGGGGRLGGTLTGTDRTDTVATLSGGSAGCARS